MNYEKTYKEALNEATIAYKDEDKHLKATLERIFPELKEEEDDRIRKRISQALHGDVLDMDEIAKADAWLEKQGKNNIGISEDTKKKLLDDLNNALEKETPESWNEFLDKQGEQHPKFRIGDTIKKKSTGDIVTISVVDLKNREYRLSNTGFIPFKCEHLWELIGQIPNDNVEPKFHEGDWVVSNKIGVLPWLIIEVTSTHYVMVSYRDCKVMVYLSDVDNDYHLWTIQDAKDGDIIYEKSRFNTFDFISIFSKFENEKEKSWAYCHIHSDCEDLIHWSFDKCAGFVNLYNYNFYPATKEQRDILFQKMKEAGYEWDSEKKELKKIE